MLEQLKELLEMQRVLDEAILKEQGIVWDEKIEEQTKVALFVELGELMNEMPTKFKHWKKTVVDNREKALIEYADALHFALSLTNHSVTKGSIRLPRINYKQLYARLRDELKHNRRY